MDAKELRDKLDEISQRLRFIEIKLELCRDSGRTMSQLAEHRRVSLENYRRVYYRQNGIPDGQALQEGEDEVD
jgi:hypothetical protein